MKLMKSLMLFITAAIISVNVQAQAPRTATKSEPATRTVNKPVKEVQRTDSKAEKSNDREEVKTEKSESKEKREHTDQGKHKGQIKNGNNGHQEGHHDVDKHKGDKKGKKKPADGRTKTGDRVNKEKKGPNGETVYTGERGGIYYLDKKGNKTYIK